VRPVLALALRLRSRTTASAAVGLVAVLLVVGALFPAVGASFAKFHLPKGVADLLGGADYGTITGWYRAEIASLYGPLVVALVAITAAVSGTAGEEESGIVALVLAHPVRRARFVAAKAAAVAVLVVAIGLAAWIGLIGGVALAHGGIPVAHLGAYALHLTFFGLAIGALALAIGCGTGHPGTASGITAAVAIAGWLINGFAPLAHSIEWLKYLSPFYYYAGSDPLTHGVDVAHLGVLAVVTLALVVVAVTTIERRDIRA
jgi:beta-exotoxin I transport system permease protein